MEQDILDYLSSVKDIIKQTQLKINTIIENHYESRAEINNSRVVTIDPNKNDIYNALSGISESLAGSYAQVKDDIKDSNRISWAGTAHEIRELLATMLRLLAPDESVRNQTWFKQAPNTSGPTQKQRVHYILLAHGAGSKERQVVEKVINLQNMIEDLVRLTYARASDAAHRFKPRSEVLRILRYFEAFAYDLLNLNE